MTFLEIILRIGLILLVVFAFVVIFEIYAKTHNVNFKKLERNIENLNGDKGTRCDNGCDYCCKDCPDKYVCPGKCIHAEDECASKNSEDSE